MISIPSRALIDAIVCLSDFRFSDAPSLSLSMGGTLRVPCSGRESSVIVYALFTFVVQ